MKTIHARTYVFALLVGILAAGGCGSSSNPTSPKHTDMGGGNGTQAVISGFSFSALTVSKGAIVTWKNNDSMVHTATSDNASGFLFDTGNIAPGTTSEGITFTQSGTFPYHCRIHPGMHGTITVQ